MITNPINQKLCSIVTTIWLVIHFFGQSDLIQNWTRLQLIGIIMMRRIKWAMFQLSTITGCRDICQNVNKSAFIIYVTTPLDVLTNISASSDRRKLKHSSFDSSRHDDSNELCFNFLRSLDADIFVETSNGTAIINAGLLTFWRISRHPVIVESWNTARWNRHDETNRTSCVTPFYDRWMPRYSLKRIFFLISAISTCWNYFGILTNQRADVELSQ